MFHIILFWVILFIYVYFFNYAYVYIIDGLRDVTKWYYKVLLRIPPIGIIVMIIIVSIEVFKSIKKYYNE